MSDLVSKYGPWALVTGASSGIGDAFARQLAALGFHLVVAARRRTRLEQLSVELSSEHGVEVRVVEADLATERGMDAVVAAAGEVELGLLVSNAGFGLKGSFLDVPLDRQQDMVRVNCLANVTLLHHVGRMLRRRGRGGIIVTSSTAAFQGIPFTAAYAGTKAFDLFLAEALAHELRADGVDVLALCPGPTDTEGPKRTGARADRMPVAPMTAEAVARAGLRGLGDSDVVVPGWLNRMGAWLTRLVPRRFAAKQAGSMIVRVTGSAQPVHGQ
jgi:short-subunit dehydrogenase